MTVGEQERVVERAGSEEKGIREREKGSSGKGDRGGRKMGKMGRKKVL